jgi:hypothetical protein
MQQARLQRVAMQHAQNLMTLDTQNDGGQPSAARDAAGTGSLPGNIIVSNRNSSIEHSSAGNNDDATTTTMSSTSSQQLIRPQCQVRQQTEKMQHLQWRSISYQGSSQQHTWA